MIRVKICGVGTKEEALFASSLGVWGVGLNFVPGSPRFLTWRSAVQIAEALPRGVRRVGVFVNAERTAMERAIERVGLDAVQLHGDEPPETCDGWGACEVIKAVSLREAGDVARLADFRATYHLADSRGNGAYGGTGKMVDWPLAARAALSCRLFLAGGLTPENVAEAVRRVHPFGVDVASGVESSPGVKDPYKMEAFFHLATRASEEVEG